MLQKNSYISSEIHSAVKQTVTEPVKAEPQPKMQVNVANVKKYVTAEMSLQLYGPVSDDEFNRRADECRKCPKRFDSKELDDSVGFCGGCGCGVTARSKLSIKLTMPDSTCPLGKWTKAQGRHQKFSDRIKSWVFRRLLG